MKYINSSITQIDSEIEKCFQLNIPNSAFRRVVPVGIKENLRNQYLQHMLEQERSETLNKNEVKNSRPVSTQVIKVNISSLREAGYCCCPKELAAACEILLRQQAQEQFSKNDLVMKVPTEKVDNQNKLSSQEGNDADFHCDQDTTNTKSNDFSADFSDLEKLFAQKKKNLASSKSISSDEISKHSHSDKNEKVHQRRNKKRKYFTKYMSNEFSKDTKPVSMSMMDKKTQELFKGQEFNELVSEITGMN